MRFLFALAGALFVALATPAAAQQLPRGPVTQPPIIRPGGPIAVCAATPATLADGLYSIRLGNGKSLDASNGGTFTENAAVIGWDHNGNPNQRWLITSVSPGRYLLRNASNAMAARANPLCAARNNCMVGTTRATRGAEQQWIIEQISGGSSYRIRDARTGKQLQISGDIAANGGAAEVSPTQGCGAHQTFNIAPIGAYRELSREDGIGRLMAINLRLNTYTPTRNQFDPSGERAYFRPNDSNLSFQVGDTTHGPFPIDIPVLELGPDRMYKTYVNDWNTTATRLSTDRRGAIIAQVNFEDAGVEIITNCHNNLNCHMGEPRFDLRDAVVTVTLRPRFDAPTNRFTFDAATDFRFAMSESGPCINNFWAFICDLALPDRASLLRTNVIDQLNYNLTEPGSIGRIGLELVLNGYAGDGGFRNVTVGPNGELIFY
jgi:hypothetical protein